MGGAGTSSATSNTSGAGSCVPTDLPPVVLAADDGESGRRPSLVYSRIDRSRVTALHLGQFFAPDAASTLKAHSFEDVWDTWPVEVPQPTGVMPSIDYVVAHEPGNGLTVWSRFSIPLSPDGEGAAILSQGDPTIDNPPSTVLLDFLPDAVTHVTRPASGNVSFGFQDADVLRYGIFSGDTWSEDDPGLCSGERLSTAGLVPLSGGFLLATTGPEVDGCGEPSGVYVDVATANGQRTPAAMLSFDVPPRRIMMRPRPGGAWLVVVTDTTAEAVALTATGGFDGPRFDLGFSDLTTSRELGVSTIGEDLLVGIVEEAESALIRLRRFDREGSVRAEHTLTPIGNLATFSPLAILGSPGGDQVLLAYTTADDNTIDAQMVMTRIDCF